MNIFGYIPVRMKSTRLPGKPLKKIKKIPLLQHVFIRSKMFRQWKDLRIATCDSEIAEHCDKNKIPYVLTSKNHAFFSTFFVVNLIIIYILFHYLIYAYYNTYVNRFIYKIECSILYFLQTYIKQYQKQNTKKSKNTYPNL